MSLVPEDVRPLEESLDAIRLANAIIIGPGSVYTSVTPNLLVNGISDAVAASRAVKVYVCNVMTQPGETDRFQSSDHVKAVVEHAGRRIFDYVLINREAPSLRLLEKYETQGAHLVSPDDATVRDMGYTPITGNFISQTEVVRHDPQKLAQAILRLVSEKSFFP